MKEEILTFKELRDKHIALIIKYNQLLKLSKAVAEDIEKIVFVSEFLHNVVFTSE